MHVVSVGVSFIEKGVWNPNQEYSKGENVSRDSMCQVEFQIAILSPQLQHHSASLSASSAS